MPVTAAIAYELLRWGARRRGLGFALNRFGLLTQRLTTAYPDAGQIEVAIAAVERLPAGRPDRTGDRGRARAGCRAPIFMTFQGSTSILRARP